LLLHSVAINSSTVAYSHKKAAMDQDRFCMTCTAGAGSIVKKPSIKYSCLGLFSELYVKKAPKKSVGLHY